MHGGEAASLVVPVAQPKDLREGMARAMQTVRCGVAHLASDLTAPLATPNPEKGSVGVLGEVLRQIPPATVVPLVVGCEVKRKFPISNPITTLSLLP